MKKATNIILCVGLAVGLGACAAGRGPGGEVIVGFDVAKLPETALEAAHAASGLLPSPWGDLLGYGVTIMGTAGVGAAAVARARKRGEDVGWEQALDPKHNAALSLPQLAPPVFVGSGGGPGSGVPAVAAAVAGSGSSPAVSAQVVAVSSPSAGDDRAGGAGVSLVQG